jgi:hypothetical protein
LETLSKVIILHEVKVVALVLSQHLTSGLEWKGGVVTVFVMPLAQPVIVLMVVVVPVSKSEDLPHSVVTLEYAL